MSDDLSDIVKKYYNVALSLSGRPVVFKDKTMIPFLAYCLSSSEASLQVVETAIDTLLLLANTDCNLVQLTGTFGVYEAVELTTTSHDLPECVKTKAAQLLRILNCKEAPAYCTRSKTKSQNLKYERQSKITKLVTLQVHGLYKECLQKLELAVVKVKGVVSVVVDINHQRCTVRVYETVSPLDIATAIFEETGMEAKLVSRNKIGQEVLKPLLETSSNDSEEDWPSYLNEDDSPVKEKAVSQMFAIKDRTSHWLNSAVGLFQKSFYW